ncbi:MAG: hypothetical protein WCU88_13275 [Elusimicrobiota bacterium]|jgi:hypothetical protein
MRILLAILCLITAAHAQGREISNASEEQLPRSEKTLSFARTQAKALGLPSADAAAIPESGTGTAYPAQRLGRPDPAARSESDAPVSDPSDISAGQDLPLSWKEIAEVVHFGSTFFSGDVSRFLDKTLGRILPKSSDASAAQAFACKALFLMQKTREGRRVLRELIEEYRLSGRTLLIRAEDYDDSMILERNNLQQIIGLRGQVIQSIRVYGFNRKFLEFKDQDLAAATLAANMAHEIQHLASEARLERLAPELVPAFSRTILDESLAKLSGYLVAAELDPRIPVYTILEARRCAQDPDAYWDSLKLSGSYALADDPEEMQDPAASYERRLRASEKSLQEMREQVRTELPRTLSAMEILSAREGLGRKLQLLRKETESSEKALALQIRSIEGNLPALREHLQDLRSGGARDAKALYSRALSQPVYQDLLQERAQAQSELRSLFQDVPLDEPAWPADQLTWKQFRQEALSSRQRHPEYWAEHIQRFGASGLVLRPHNKRGFDRAILSVRQDARSEQC